MPFLSPYDQRAKARLMRFIQRDESTGCWHFTGTRERGGYGMFRYQRKMRCAHRVSYELHFGNPIEPGLHIDHLCRNRSCCNPDHLEPVTRELNWLRSMSVTRLNQLATHCKHGHELSGVNLGRRADGNRRCLECQRKSSRVSKARIRGRRIIASLPVIGSIYDNRRESDTDSTPLSDGRLF
jgi:hypothetical protein